jgi:hemerythrin-like domain-containing protein
MTVNTLDMVLVHRVFRREFRYAAEFIEGVRAGDVAHAQVVGDHLTFMLSALHHHHAAEDDLVWPKLQARVASSEADLQRMVDEHAAIAAAVHRVEKRVRRRAASLPVEYASAAAVNGEAVRSSDHSRISPATLRVAVSTTPGSRQ